MEMEEWVEVQGKTVEVALTVALEELKLSSPDDAEVEVVEEPQKGFLGLGGRDALIRVRAKPKRRRKRRRRSRKGAPSTEDAGDKADKANTRQRSSSRKSSGSSGKDRTKQQPEKRRREPARQTPSEPTEDQMDVETQAQVVTSFLEGLLNAFGLEGSVETRIEDGYIYADVTGEQTEALVGPKGAIMQAIQELTRTVVQRQSRDSARIRLDIAGYGERRRSALKIYTTRLAEQVLDSGREALLEPMNPSDRKVVHDVIADIDGVRSYSEGEEPNRSVVVGLVPGYEPKSQEAAEESNGVESEDRSESGSSEDPTSDETAVDASAENDNLDDGEANGGDEADNGVVDEDVEDEADEN